ncbi:PREDICTED: aldehyde dehydrogenase family 3 member H1-like [Populus euphratica]|uniref:Aldehyde dehydrogenase n=1 Tax=Populus euphratica TaxID=75702 RepID=A0AAJ6UKY6_POPEU|nr:PREDICTED: aldehyde dehydrogenase family 3 member H1-like [Populus euphratica]
MFLDSLPFVAVLRSSVVDIGARRSFTSCYPKKTNQKHEATLSFPRSGPILKSLCVCLSPSTTPSVMTEGKKQPFDANEAPSLVKELKESFRTGRTRSYEWRVSQLKGIEKIVEEREKDISEALYKDLSKPEFEAFVSEIAAVKSSCEEALKELKQWMKPEKAKTSMTAYPSSAEIVSEPLGAVLVISTWNYPFLLSIDPVIGAIAAGNAVVLKPSEIAPATSSLLSELFEEYLDNSAVRVVEGAVPETAALLEQKWDKIFYTGSPRVGRIVMTAAAKHLTPVILELGGKCPVVVDSDVDLQVTVRRIIAGKWQLNNGQACISVDYIITTKDFAPKLIDALRNGIEEFFGADPMESKYISRIVSSNHFSRLERLLDEDKVCNKIVVGGQRNQKKLKIAPTIFLDVPEDSQLMQEEIFGPLLPIITVENAKDSIDLINSKPEPLVAYLFTNNQKLRNDFVQNVSCGGMVINDTVLHVTVSSLPFGGVGESGMGSYHGKFSFDAFSHKKAVLYRSFSGDSPVRYPPYTPENKKLMRAVMNGGILDIILALMGWSRD